MKLIIFHSLYFVILIGNYVGVNSSHIKSKIFKGKPAREGEYTFIASLQLNEVHMCSSGFFQKGFLLTTRSCGLRMLDGMTKENKTGTAVFGNLNLNQGQRTIILEILHPFIKRYEESTAVVMLAESVDYTNIEIPKLYKPKVNCRQMGALAVACGWGTVTVDDVVENHTGTTKHSDNLHCLSVILYSGRQCNLEFGTADFSKKLMCGEAFHRSQKSTLGYVGSPLIKTMTKNSVEEIYIIGVTMSPILSGQTYIHRFVRIDYALPHIQKSMDDMQLLEEADAEYDSSSTQTELSYKMCKRRKL